MNSCVRESPLGLSAVQAPLNTKHILVEQDHPSEVNSQQQLPPASRPGDAARIRVYVAAENRLLREALANIMAKHATLNVIRLNSSLAFDAGTLVAEGIDVLLLASQASIQDDLATIQRVHSAVPSVRILLIASTQQEGEFLQCVRAGISGYLRRGAKAAEILDGIRAVQAGEAVCPGALCSVLFRYFERETPGLPFASPRQRLGLTRREQQLVPLIAKGFTNKEIANHFCLSEQTVKNHLYRMKHKIGAEDRLNIVQRFRTQGFLL
jgi:DNA-binding NarL/FixJ family response regulator